MMDYKAIAEEAIHKVESWMTTDPDYYWESDDDERYDLIDADIDDFFHMIVNDYKDTEALMDYVSAHRSRLINWIVEEL